MINNIFRRLKDRYAASIIAGWTESSDPEKFVHEDIGIAAYLLELWRQQRQQEDWPPDKRQSFVDLGCGNGLLVFILSSEGHPGLGLDLRRRNIWDSFPASVELREQAVEAGLETAWPGKDWLLGNHSDELTPWLPIMAARFEREDVARPSIYYKTLLGLGPATGPSLAVLTASLASTSGGTGGRACSETTWTG